MLLMHRLRTSYLMADLPVPGRSTQCFLARYRHVRHGWETPSKLTSDCFRINNLMSNIEKR